MVKVNLSRRRSLIGAPWPKGTPQQGYQGRFSLPRAVDTADTKDYERSSGGNHGKLVKTAQVYLSLASKPVADEMVAANRAITS